MQGIYLVTGATGFIGACLTRELVRQKKYVSVIVRDKRLNWRLRDIASKLDIHECDLLSKSLDAVIARIMPTYIFHLASYGSLPSENIITQMIDVNIRGTINLINASKKHRFKLFINAGSSSEYGIKSEKMKESDIITPVNDYGVTKAAATLFCQKEAIRNNLPIITFRLFSPYGYFEDKSRLIPLVIASALKNQSMELSFPDNVRDFIFIEDVVNAYIKTTENKSNPGEIYNIGSGEQHQISDVVNLVLQITNSNSKIAWGKVKKQTRQIEPKKWEADISKAQEILKWQPNHKLDTGLKKTIEWFKQYSNLYAQ